MRVVLFAVLTAFSGPALAHQNAAPAPNASEKQICKREEMTGSILGGKRVCHTAAEWAKIRDARQNGTDRVLNERRDRPVSGSAGAVLAD